MTRPQLTREQAYHKLSTYFDDIHTVQWLDWDISKPERRAAALDYMLTLMERIEVIEPVATELKHWCTYQTWHGKPVVEMSTPSEVLTAIQDLYSNRRTYYLDWVAWRVDHGALPGQFEGATEAEDFTIMAWLHNTPIMRILQDQYGKLVGHEPNM